MCVGNPPWVRSPRFANPRLICAFSRLRGREMIILYCATQETDAQEEDHTLQRAMFTRNCPFCLFKLFNRKKRQARNAFSVCNNCTHQVVGSPGSISGNTIAKNTCWHLHDVHLFFFLFCCRNLFFWGSRVVGMKRGAWRFKRCIMWPC